MNLKLNPHSHKIAYRTGNIQGLAKGMIIRTDMTREEQVKSLKLIEKYAKEIHYANKKLLKLIPYESNERQKLTEVSQK